MEPDVSFYKLPPMSKAWTYPVLVWDVITETLCLGYPSYIWFGPDLSLNQTDYLYEEGLHDLKWCYSRFPVLEH